MLLTQLSITAMFSRNNLNELAMQCLTLVLFAEGEYAKEKALFMAGFFGDDRDRFLSLSNLETLTLEKDILPEVALKLFHQFQKISSLQERYILWQAMQQVASADTVLSSQERLILEMAGRIFFLPKPGEFQGEKSTLQSLLEFDSSRAN